MEPFGSILGALGSIASVISLYFLWKQNHSWMLRGLLGLVVILTASSSYVSYRYFEATKPEVIRRAHQAELKNAVELFLAKYPTTTSYWEPGQNEGIVKSGLIILELHKELFPDSYTRIRKDIEADLSYAQQYRDKQEQRAAMDTAAKNVLTILRNLAGHG